MNLSTNRFQLFEGHSPLKWIAERLQMGTWTHLSNRLYHVQV